MRLSVVSCSPCKWYINSSILYLTLWSPYMHSSSDHRRIYGKTLSRKCWNQMHALNPGARTWWLFHGALILDKWRGFCYVYEMKTILLSYLGYVSEITSSAPSYAPLWICITQGALWDTVFLRVSLHVYVYLPARQLQLLPTKSLLEWYECTWMVPFPQIHTKLCWFDVAGTGSFQQGALGSIIHITSIQPAVSI